MLSEIAAACGGEYKTDVCISGVSIDTRKITPGCLFICIIGERFDAHDFISDAIEKGAAAVMVSKDIDIAAPYVKVADTAKALLALGAYYRRLFDINVVGITGSVGKTTAKEFTYLALSSALNTVKTQGNLNNEIGLPQTLFNIDSSTRAAVIEMGMNHFGEISRLSEAAAPTVAVITNIGVSHIENLGSRAGILKAKLEILNGMKPGSALILNGDDDLLSTVRNDKFKIYTFSVNAPADFKAQDISEQGGATTFSVSYFGKRQGIEIPAAGIHNVYNALAAFAVAVILKLDSKKAAAKLNEYTPAGMRQRIKKVGSITVIEDCYNASPDSMAAALKTLAGMGCGKKIAVLGDMLELGSYSEKAHSDVGKAAAACGIDCLLAVGQETKHTVKAAREAGLSDSWHFDTKEQLQNFLFDKAQSGDCVLFKASRRVKLEDIMTSIYKRWE